MRYWENMKYAKLSLGLLLLLMFVSIALAGRSHAKDKSAVSPSDLALQVNSVATLQSAGTNQKIPLPSINVTAMPTQSSSISDTEKQKIDNWIKKNNLNQYGDAKDTMYAGGTPLFNETTGKTMDRYEYILSKNPTRPWNK